MICYVEKDLENFTDEAMGIFLPLKDKILNSLQNMVLSVDEVPDRATGNGEANRLVAVLGNFLFSDIAKRLKRADVFSIMIDESMDSSGTEQLLVYAIWVEHGEKVVRMIGLISTFSNGSLIFSSIEVFMVRPMLSVYSMNLLHF